MVQCSPGYRCRVMRILLSRCRRVIPALFAGALMTILVVGCSADPAPAVTPSSVDPAAPSSSLAETAPSSLAESGVSGVPTIAGSSPSTLPTTIESITPPHPVSATAPTPAPMPMPTTPITTAGTALPAVGIAGVNDPQCRSDDPPVVLLHGTFSTVASSFSAMTPALQSSGRCVYALGYGSNGTAPVRTSATQVAAFIRTVLDVTGADQVDVIGYSQGGLVLRTALRDDELAASVSTAVLIAPSFHGTDSPLLDSLPAGLCPACEDQRAGSALLTELASGGDLGGAVRYVVVSTNQDTVVTPVSSQVPVGPPDRVTALVVQDRCPADTVDHVHLPADPTVIAWTVAALDTGGRPDPEALPCS